MGKGLWWVSAYDAHGNSVDFSGLTVEEIEAGADWKFLANGAVKVTETVRRVKSGIVHDWDAGTHVRRNVAYFRVTPRFSDRASDIYVTVWGSQCHVGKDPGMAMTRQEITRHPDGQPWIIQLRKDGTCYAPRKLAYRRA